MLESVQKKDKALGRKLNDQRRFIIVEGLYRNSGTIAPLDEIIALKHEFHYRLMLDESHSFGTLGKTGRGTLELFNKRLMFDAEIVTISIENALGSIGGVTIGNEEVVDHQRLSGAGYCFSASSPPFTASAAIKSLEQLDTVPSILESCQKNRAYFYKGLTDLIQTSLDGKVVLVSDELSPMFFLELAEPSTDPAGTMIAIETKCLEQGLAVQSTSRAAHGNAMPPALRLNVSGALTEKDMKDALVILRKVISSIVV